MPESSSHPAARDHCPSLVRAVDRPIGAARYGRMFPGLDSLVADPGLLMRSGGDGGICDAAAVLDQLGPGGDDATEAAGWPFFGQFIAHDITADRSPITGGVDPEELRNARVPKLNLEGVYADGPIGSPYLFDFGDPAKLLLGPDGADVPRNHQGVALIGDPRNDVHLFSLNLHVALLHAHNRIVDRLREHGVPEADVFGRARTTLTWHYQWIVVQDFLPRLVGASVVEQVLAEGGRWFAPPPGRPTFRSSSPTRRSDTATARSGTSTGSSKAVPRCRCSPTWSASARCTPAGAWTSRRSSTCPVTHRRSAPSASTADSPPASSGCPSRSPAWSAPPPTARWRSATCSAAEPSGCPAARRSRGSSARRR